MYLSKTDYKKLYPLMTPKQQERVNKAIKDPDPRDSPLDALGIIKIGSPLYKKLLRFSKYVRDSYNIIKKLYPLDCKYFKHISKSGWTPIQQESSIHMIPKMKYRITLSTPKLNQLFGNILSKNRNYFLFKNLNELIKQLDNGHAKQAKMIKHLIKDKPNYYIICFGTLFSILEYILYEYGIRAKSRNTFSKKVASSKRVLIRKFSNRHRELLTLFLWCDYMTIENLYKSTKGYNYNHMPYGRNTVIHGRFNPNHFKFIEFEKLILLCRNISIDLKCFHNIKNEYQNLESRINP